jgi:hypothetical protein
MINIGQRFLLLDFEPKAIHHSKPIIGNLSLQDFTVLPTEIFRRCVITSSLVIYLPTSSLTNYFRRLSARR